MRPPGRRRAARHLPTVAGLLALSACGDDPSALAPRGTGAREIAVLWWVMFALGTAVMALVVVVLVRAGRRRPATAPDAPAPATGGGGPDAADPAVERAGNRWILWGGVVLPVVVVVPLSFLTLVIGQRLWTLSTDDALEIEVVGHQYWWEVRYPETGAVTANEIHIPVGRNVHIRMTSEDVIHSFWVPSLHGKMDLTPGEETDIVIDADRPGTYEGLCAEFCGIQHTHMKFLVVAHEEDDFAAWLERESADAAAPRTERAERGAEVFAEVGCASCHAVRGTDARGVAGPDLTHVGSRLTLGANTIPNNRGNLGGWIANPQRIKPGNLMPPSVLDGDELLALIDYLEGLE